MLLWKNMDRRMMPLKTMAVNLFIILVSFLQEKKKKKRNVTNFSMADIRDILGFPPTVG